MDDFLRRLAAALDVPELEPEQIETLLATARDVAHGTERRHAPLASFLVGMAIGRGSSLPAATATVHAALSPPGS